MLMLDIKQQNLIMQLSLKQKINQLKKKHINMWNNYLKKLTGKLQKDS